MSSALVALRDVIGYLNSVEDPYDEFSACLIFLMTQVKGPGGAPLDGSLLSDAVQNAFLQVESAGLLPFSGND